MYMHAPATPMHQLHPQLHCTDMGLNQSSYDITHITPLSPTVVVLPAVVVAAALLGGAQVMPTL